jgi:pimeloyl-ACP methyl ester carboxylesterase
MAWLTIAFSIILILFIIYLMVCAGYFIFHRFFIMFPSRKISAGPSTLNLEYEEAFLKTNDNIRIQSWFIKGTSVEEWIDLVFVLFPGNKGTISDFLEPMSYLAKSGFNVLLFSYRGFGRSQKKWPTEKGAYKDSEAACEYLLKEKNIDEKNIIFLGQSLGCAMAARMAGLYNPRALLLEGGFPSIGEVAGRAIKWLPLRLLTTSRFDTKHYLSKVECPVLILHSREDKAIPLSDANDLLDAAGCKKKMEVISGPHAKGLIYDRKKYLDAVEHFLKEIDDG